MFTAHVESSIHKYERESKNASYDALDNAFAIEEVSAVCVQLPNGKSPGPDGLTYEHIKYGAGSCHNEQSHSYTKCCQEY
jgi:hypothetical protein